ncbi:hypothetical protein MA16_Dca017288 [Dendrobium catenatum]|uniref:Uncharacterized protein n=1 Tax=Dendrobium catenatum TaxID=906689 RepID=A0A2I0XG41_9ASPA|nr:hypothetical protein MA16_Dca017288 [Dendrobium catenatum]
MDMTCGERGGTSGANECGPGCGPAGRAWPKLAIWVQDCWFGELRPTGSQQPSDAVTQGDMRAQQPGMREFCRICVAGEGTLLKETIRPATASKEAKKRSSSGGQAVRQQRDYSVSGCGRAAICLMQRGRAGDGLSFKTKRRESRHATDVLRALRLDSTRRGSFRLNVAALKIFVWDVFFVGSSHSTLSCVRLQAGQIIHRVRNIETASAEATKAARVNHDEVEMMSIKKVFEGKKIPPWCEQLTFRAMMVSFFHSVMF